MFLHVVGSWLASFAKISTIKYIFLFWDSKMVLLVLHPGLKPNSILSLSTCYLINSWITLSALFRIWSANFILLCFPLSKASYTISFLSYTNSVLIASWDSLSKLFSYLCQWLLAYHHHYLCTPYQLFPD